MRWKVLSLLAAMVLVASCSTSPEESVQVGGAGTVNTPPVGVSGGVGAVSPGSAEDFVVNVGDRVFFDFDRSDLSAEGQATLSKQAQWLRQYQAVRVTIEGHTDERGTREYNLALGDRRAAAVRNYLIANGVDPSRITTISYGKERPAVLGNDERAFAQNRRAVTVVN